MEESEVDEGDEEEVAREEEGRVRQIVYCGHAQAQVST